MRTSALTLFLGIALISLGACRKPAGTQPAANSNDAAVHEAPVGGKAMTGDKFYFRGTIAKGLISIQRSARTSTSPAQLIKTATSS